MRFDESLRRRADAVREVPLEQVLARFGAKRDKRDRFKWHTAHGPVTVTGCKFHNWQCNVGGGGAIDLVMHLAQVDFRDAVPWLEQHFAAGCVTPYATHTAFSASMLRLPVRDDHMLGRVREYLTQRRRLPARVIESLIKAGRIYADCRANAVFLLVTGKSQRPVGADLRGTGRQAWRGMAPGTSKDRGYFWVGDPAATEIVVCEAAIDAISCYVLHPDRICISTSGVRANPLWLEPLISRNYQIECGFDADFAGDTAAAQMIELHPTIKRLRPPAHDWNDILTQRS